MNLASDRQQPSIEGLPNHEAKPGQKADSRRAT